MESERVRQALERILASDKFLAAPQMSAFLRYVVEETIDGNSDRIKAYTVAVDALGKPDSFDPQNDPVVRVLAGRLRSSLEAYHEANPETDIIIRMKPGTYVPVFLSRATDEALTPQQFEYSAEPLTDGPAANSFTAEATGQDVREQPDRCKEPPAPDVGSDVHSSIETTDFDFAANHLSNHTPENIEEETPAARTAAESGDVGADTAVSAVDVHPEDTGTGSPGSTGKREHSRADTGVRTEKESTGSWLPPNVGKFAPGRYQTDASVFSSMLAGKQSPGTAVRWLTLPLRYPRATAAFAVLFAIGSTLYVNQHAPPEPAIQSALPDVARSSTDAATHGDGTSDTIALFVDARAPSGSLQGRLNTLLSGAFSESENVRVYRILEHGKPASYGSRDLLLNLEIVQLTEDTQVSVQLLQANTGRLLHAEIIRLSAHAATQLSSEEFDRVMQLARSMARADGPLMTAR